MVNNWKVGDKFKLNSEAIDTHTESYYISGEVFEIGEVWNAGVATTSHHYFLFKWIEVPNYMKSPLWKKLEGE